MKRGDFIRRKTNMKCVIGGFYEVTNIKRDGAVYGRRAWTNEKPIYLFRLEDDNFVVIKRRCIPVTTDVYDRARYAQFIYLPWNKTTKKLFEDRADIGLLVLVSRTYSRKAYYTECVYKPVLHKGVAALKVYIGNIQATEEIKLR